MNSAKNIHVKGVVQGVGFRPFVYKQAKKYLQTGWVLNSEDGVHIHAEGEEKLLDEFCLSLANDAPAASCVESVEMQDVPLQNFKEFSIRFSEDKKMSKAGAAAGTTLVSPDLATCKDCVAELFNKKDRRYRYPFINCTNCGPRFTIIEDLPYDRAKTSMKNFKMCNICNNEYGNPENRRFHAQPNACFDCGPKISWVEVKNRKVDCAIIEWGIDQAKSDEIFSKCVKFLKQGKIVAIKGLGGFHLACDAENEEAVARLREKKQRSNKAFAIMAKNIDDAKQICKINEIEQNWLEGSARPIVLLKNLAANKLAPSVLMGLPETGVMLPYTPVQHLLMNDFCEAGGRFLVMTSGNIYDNPILTKDEKAYEVLANVADAFLGNNREILSRYDDSVIRVVNLAGVDAIQMIRRARGFAPSPIKLKLSENSRNFGKTIFATGPEQKNSFCYLRPIADANNQSKYNAEAFVSQHVGDLENFDIMKAWEDAKNTYEHVFKFKLEKIIHDAHPEYLSSKWAAEQALQDKISVQHHFAHIASVMAENRLNGPVLGIAFDGTGYGADGNIWGGEALICNNQDYERFINFTYAPMPGGAAAIKQPLRMAYGLLWAFDLLDDEVDKTSLASIDDKEKENLLKMIEAGINCPQTSSVGRIFDAVSALLGICPQPTYEGESAIMLEAALWQAFMKDKALYGCAFDSRYEIQIVKNVGTKESTAHDTSVLLWDCANMFKALLEDIENSRSKAEIVKNFHDAFVLAIATAAQICNQIYGIKEVALSGGVFMNRYLLERTSSVLMQAGFTVAVNKDVPPNDGGVSLGQVFVG